jgi:Bacteriophage protein of unknown function (DUF646).
MNIRIDITGQDKVIGRLRSLGGDSTRVLAAALYQEGEGLIAEAKQETPVDTGALRASGYVAQPVTENSKVTVQVGFGGIAAPYAVFVHENAEANHPVGKWKYLEDPAKRRASTMAGRIAKRIDDMVKK